MMFDVVVVKLMVQRSEQERMIIALQLILPLRMAEIFGLKTSYCCLPLVW